MVDIKNDPPIFEIILHKKYDNKTNTESARHSFKIPAH